MAYKVGEQAFSYSELVTMSSAVGSALWRSGSESIRSDSDLSAEALRVYRLDTRRQSRGLRIRTHQSYLEARPGHPHSSGFGGQGLSHIGGSTSDAFRLSLCQELSVLVLVDRNGADDRITTLRWSDLASATPGTPRSALETDMAASLYASGSTGRPKGVVLWHRNIVVDAQSVASYLENDEQDHILSVCR